MTAYIGVDNPYDLTPLMAKAIVEAIPVQDKGPYTMIRVGVSANTIQALQRRHLVVYSFGYGVWILTFKGESEQRRLRKEMK